MNAINRVMQLLNARLKTTTPRERKVRSYDSTTEAR